MIPTSSPFRQAIDYRQSFTRPAMEPAIQRFNPLEKLAQLFQPRPQASQMADPTMGPTAPAAPMPPRPPVPMPPPYGEPSMTMQRRPNPMAGLGARISDSAMPEILMALGAGISSGNLATGSSMLPGLMEQASARKRTKKDLMESMQSREQLAQMLEEKGETELAAGVRGGYIDPENAFNDYVKTKREKEAAANKPILDEFGIERNPDGSFRNRFDEERYNRERRKADIEERKLQGDLSKQEREQIEFERKMELEQKKAAGGATASGNRGAQTDLAFAQIYKNLGYDPSTGVDKGEAPAQTYPEKAFKFLDDNVIPGDMGDRATGLSGWAFGWVPGSSATNIDESKKQLEATTIVSELQKLRSNGTTLGQVTQYEHEFLKALQGSLSRSQSREQFLQNLRLYDAATKRMAESGEGLYEDDPVLQQLYQEMLNNEAGAAPADATMQNSAPGGVDAEAEALMDQYAPKR